MGYEVRMYYGEKLGHVSDGWVSVVGMVDLCKIGRGKVSEINSKDGPEGFIYADDGNTHITEDCYGSKIRIHPAKDFLKALKADNKVEKYRRYDIAIAALTAALKGFGDDLVVVLYGY